MSEALAALEQGLVEALSAFHDARWRVAVIGRVSAGKSSLLNALLGEERLATGLGGVTREVTALEVGEVVVIDTPGIDEVVAALDHLDPLLATADAVVWVVDGLQPLTESERLVVEALLEPGTHLYVVVTKLDLVAADQPELVLQRVRSLTHKHRPRAVQRLDLREPVPIEDPPFLALGPFPSRSRANALATWTSRALVELDATTAPDPSDVLAELRESWRDAIRGAEQRVEDGIEDGPLSHPERALHRLSREIGRARTAWLDALEDTGRYTALGRPELPDVAPPDPAGRWKSLMRGFGGASAARRLVKAEAARCLVEGDVVLEDWLEPLRDREDLELRQRQHALRARLIAARDLARLD